MPICFNCPTVFDPPARGRPPKYCSEACRQAAWRERHKGLPSYGSPKRIAHRATPEHVPTAPRSRRPLRRLIWQGETREELEAAATLLGELRRQYGVPEPVDEDAGEVLATKRNETPAAPPAPAAPPVVDFDPVTDAPIIEAMRVASAIGRLSDEAHRGAPHRISKVVSPFLTGEKYASMGGTYGPDEDLCHLWELTPRADWAGPVKSYNELLGTPGYGGLHVRVGTREYVVNGQHVIARVRKVCGVEGCSRRVGHQLADDHGPRCEATHPTSGRRCDELAGHRGEHAGVIRQSDAGLSRLKWRNDVAPPEVPAPKRNESPAPPVGDRCGVLHPRWRKPCAEPSGHLWTHAYVNDLGTRIPWPLAGFEQLEREQAMLKQATKRAARR